MLGLTFNPHPSPALIVLAEKACYCCHNFIDFELTKLGTQLPLLINFYSAYLISEYTLKEFPINCLFLLSVFNYLFHSCFLRDIILKFSYTFIVEMAFKIEICSFFYAEQG